MADRVRRHRWVEDHVEAIGSRNSDDKFAAAYPYLHGATGRGRVVLHVNVDDFSQAAEGEGVYPEFSPESARELGLALISAAQVAEGFARGGGVPADYFDD